jgi:hypothetical protein
MKENFRFPGSSYAIGIVSTPYERQSGERYSEPEIEQRRESALRRMLSAPHRPHKPKKKSLAAQGERGGPRHALFLGSRVGVDEILP